MSASDDLRGLIVRRPVRGGATVPVEQWLRSELAAAYDAILTENVPDEWLALIDKAPTGH